MHHRSLIRRSRRRLVGERQLQPAAAGFIRLGLASGRRTADVHPAQWQDLLVVEVSSDFAAELLDCWSFDMDDFQEAQQCAAFVNLLAGHPDARIRGAAAADGRLEQDVAERLANDASYKVRNALAQNEKAVSRLPLEVLRRVAESDDELAWWVLNSLSSALNDAAGGRNNEEGGSSGNPEFQALREKTLDLVQCLWAHPDYRVREKARSIQARLANPPAAASPLPKRGFRKGRPVGSREIDPLGQSGDYVYAFVLLQDGAEGAVIDKTKPWLMIPLISQDRIASELSYNVENDGLVARLAAHPSSSVREEVARRSPLPAKALEILKTDDSYNVRHELLRNDEALLELSEEDILHILRADPGLIADNFQYGCRSSRLAKILKKHFSGSPDPFVRSIVAALDE